MLNIVIAFVLLANTSFGQEMQSGLLVEKVGAGSPGEKAGIREGDVLLEWSTQIGATGRLDPLYGLETLRNEQGFIGIITLKGLRGGQPATWTGSPVGGWGLQTRPAMSEGLLSLHRQARELANDHKPLEAAERWREAARRAEKTSQETDWLPSWFLVQAGNTLVEAKKYQEAEVFYQEVTQKQPPDSLGLARVLLNRAIDASRMGDWRKAEDYYERAIPIFEKRAPESADFACSLGGLGSLFFTRSDAVRAEEYLARAVELGQKLWPESLFVAANLTNLALAVDARGDLERAERFHLHVFEIQSKAKPGPLAAYNLNNLAMIATARGDLAKAEDYFRRSLAIKEKIMPNTMPLANTLNNLGEVAVSRGELTKAERYQKRALAIREKLAPDGTDVAMSLINLGDIEQHRGDVERAEQYYLRSLSMLEKLESKSSLLAEGLNDLGEIEYSRGNLEKAEAYELRALELHKKLAPATADVANSLTDLGILAYERGDFIKAEAYERDSLAILEKLSPGSLSYADSLAWLARIMVRNGKHKEAAELYEQALHALESQTSHLGGSDESRTAFRAKHLVVYGEYADLLLQERQPELAFQVLERSRARGLLEMLASAHLDIHKGADAELLARERSLAAEIAAKSARRAELLSRRDIDNAETQLRVINDEIAGLVSQYGDVEGQIRATSPEYAALSHPSPWSVADVQQQLLDPGTALLEYSLGDERSHVFLVTQGSVTAYELPKRAVIEESVREAYALLTARNNASKGETDEQRQRRVAEADTQYLKAATRLSRMLLGPVTEQFSAAIHAPDGKQWVRIRRLLIVADDALHYLPFAALPLPARPGVPVIADYEIIDLPSVSVLALLRQASEGRQKPGRAVAVLADPVFDGRDVRVLDRQSKLDREQQPQQELESAEQTESAKESRSAEQLTRSAADMSYVRLPRLQQSRKEAQNILAAAEPAGQTMLALDFDASRPTATNPELARYRIVHFATHGLLNSRHPELSGLVLSLVNKDGLQQDGFLGLQDIYNLNLPADLVVLSACQTALGKNIQGEGVIGLTRGFMYAGATRVVASLWEINDEATAELMASFYSFMVKQRMSPAAALRAAQIKMWKQKRWNTPYYWGAFQIYGEWK